MISLQFQTTFLPYKLFVTEREIYVNKSQLLF